MQEEGEVFFNVIKNIPQHGICSPFNLHSYRKATIFMTCTCDVCLEVCYPWNEVAYCIKCTRYSHRKCMRSRKNVCERSLGASPSQIFSPAQMQSSKNDDFLFLKYALEYDLDFWPKKFHDVYNAAMKAKARYHFDGVIKIPKSSSSSTPLVVIISNALIGMLSNTKSFVYFLCVSLHKTVVNCVANLTNYKLCLQTGRQCLNTITSYIMECTSPMMPSKRRSTSLPDILLTDFCLTRRWT